MTRVPTSHASPPLNQPSSSISSINCTIADDNDSNASSSSTTSSSLLLKSSRHAQRLLAALYPDNAIHHLADDDDTNTSSASVARIRTNHDGADDDDVTVILPRDIIMIIIDYARRVPQVCIKGYERDSMSYLTISPLPLPLSSSSASTYPLTAGKTAGDDGDDPAVRHHVALWRSPPTLTAAATAAGVAAKYNKYDKGESNIWWSHQGVIGDYMYVLSGGQPAVRRYHLDTKHMIQSSSDHPLPELAVYHDTHDYGVSAVYNDQLLFGGGGDENEEDHRTCEWYNPERNQWTYGIPFTYSDHSDGNGVVLNNRLLIAGGSDLSDENDDDDDTTPSVTMHDQAPPRGRVCEAYDARCDSKIWQLLSPLPESRWAFGMVTISDYQALIVGGCTHRDDTRAILEYDSRNDRWMESTRYPLFPESMIHNLDGTAHIITDDYHRPSLVFIPCLWRHDLDDTYPTARDSLKERLSMPLAYYIPLNASTMTPLPSCNEWIPIIPPSVDNNGNDLTKRNAFLLSSTIID